jgi:hypothetical protein
MEISINNDSSRLDIIHLRIKEIIENSIKRGIKIDVEEINRMMETVKQNITEYNNSIDEWFDIKFDNDKKRYIEKIKEERESSRKYEIQSYVRIID